jgi:hypothetical protein
MDVTAEKFAIQELAYLYAYYCDRFDADNWVDCFTEDAVFDESEKGLGRHVGHDAIRKTADSRVERVEQMIHMVTNHLIFDLTPTNARGHIFAINEVIYKTGERFRINTIYEDEYRKIDGRWKFSSRTARNSLPKIRVMPD